MASGIRWAETTSAWYATPNSSQAVAAGCITGQSESEPMTIPTWAGDGSGIDFSHQVGGGMPSSAAHLLEILAGCCDMPELASRPDLLAVELHPQSPISGEAMHQGRWQVGHR